MRTLIAIFVFAIVADTAGASAVDALSTKQAVQDFMFGGLSRSGIIYLAESADLSQAERRRAYLAQPQPAGDTIPVQDPITGKLRYKVMPHEFNPDCHCCNDTNQYPLNYPFAQAAEIMANHPWYFCKADIDHNGYTDLVVDAGLVIVVMDMAGRLEGHLFGEEGQLSFLNFISLPDGSAALLLKNNYELCSSDTPRPCNKVDTVVYRFHGFAKYNSHFKPAGIVKIAYEYRVSNGMSCDGNTWMEISSSGRCLLRYSQFDAVFAGTLDNQRRKELWDLAAYVDMRSQKDWYYEAVDHSRGSSFNVYFDDGTVKRISVWACKPPLGLDYLGRCISDISREIDWEISAAHKGFEILRQLNNLSADFQNDCGCSL